jgi:hypothetical protein
VVHARFEAMRPPCVPAVPPARCPMVSCAVTMAFST